MVGSPTILCSASFFTPFLIYQLSRRFDARALFIFILLIVQEERTSQYQWDEPGVACSSAHSADGIRDEILPVQPQGRKLYAAGSGIHRPNQVNAAGA